jgi:hypothetical protein
MEFHYGLPLQVRGIPLLHHNGMVAEPYRSHRNDNNEHHSTQMAQLQSSTSILPTLSFEFCLARNCPHEIKPQNSSPARQICNANHFLGW